LFRERTLLDRTPRRGLGGTEGFPYVATFAAVAPWWDRWSELVGDLSALGLDVATGASIGATALGRGGALVKLLCPSAPSLMTAVAAIWKESRRRLLGLAALPLRKF